MKNEVRLGAHMRTFILCVDASGVETILPLPGDRRLLAPTLKLLKAAYGYAQVVAQNGENKSSRIGVAV